MSRHGGKSTPLRSRSGFGSESCLMMDFFPRPFSAGQDMWNEAGCYADGVKLIGPSKATFLKIDP